MKEGEFKVTVRGAEIDFVFGKQQDRAETEWIELAFEDGARVTLNRSKNLLTWRVVSAHGPNLEAE